jgi:hypothetical protein
MKSIVHLGRPEELRAVKSSCARHGLSDERLALHLATNNDNLLFRFYPFALRAAASVLSS